MAKYSKQTTVGGKWAKATELSGVKRAKIVSETEPQSSSFTNKDGSPKTQDVCKVQFEGINEPLNVSLNRATINGLVDAFGEDSSKWMNHYLSVETEKVRVAGKAVVALYLIPAGYKKVDDNNGYAMIVTEEQAADAGATVSLDDDEEPPVNVPF
jgi:hypothetical protein